MKAPPSRGRTRATTTGEEPLEELLRHCVQGDDAAKARFISRYGSFIRASIARKLNGYSTLPPVHGDVEDVYNEFLARLLDNQCRMLRQLTEVQRIEAWLMTAARNYTVDYVRRWASRMRGQVALAHEPAPVNTESPRQKAQEKERAELAHALMDLLGPADKLVVDLYFMHGLKYSEIAEVTGQNINTVAARLHRAKSKMRRKWLEANTQVNGTEQ